MCLVFPIETMAQENWPQFRGPDGSGVAESAHPPIHFGLETNLSWRTDAPPGVSSPIIWRDRVFVTGFTNRQLITLWHHDGLSELIVLGRGQVDGYELGRGQLKWWVRGWGFSAVTTPVAGDNLLFVGGRGMGDPSAKPDPLFDWNMLIGKYDANHDQQLAINEVPESLTWQIRKEVPTSTPGNSWALRGLLGAMVDRNHDGTVTKSEWDAAMARRSDKFMADRFVAIRPGGSGDGTDSFVQWETTRGLPELPSPLYYQGGLYFVTDGGMVTVTDPKSGKRLLDRERLGTGGQYVASPIAANGLVYVVNERGTLTVFRAGNTLDVVAVNKLGEEVRCTPAIAGNALIVRTANHLWAFAQK